MIAWFLACVPLPDPEPMDIPDGPVLAEWRRLAYIDAVLAGWAQDPEVELLTLGTSVEGRSLHGLRIRSDATPETAPGVLVTATLHAREWIAASSALHIAERLVERTDPTATEILERWEVVVVPVANPDGYRYSWTTDRLWRKNRSEHASGARGVDLNRNWGEAWGQTGSSPQPDNNNYRGEAAFSEPETAALRDFVVDEPHLQVHLDLHSPGQLALHPWGHTDRPSSVADSLVTLSTNAATAMEDLHGTPYDAGSFHERLYPGSGIAIDWTHAQGLDSLLFELRDRGQFGFRLADELREPAAEEAWVGFVTLTQ